MQGKMYVIECPHAWIDGKAVSVVGYGMSQNVVHHQYKYGARVSLSSTPADSSISVIECHYRIVQLLWDAICSQYAVQGWPSDGVKGLFEVNESENKVHLLCLTTLYQPSQCKHMLCSGSMRSKSILVGSEMGVHDIADPTYKDAIVQFCSCFQGLCGQGRRSRSSVPDPV